MVTLMTAISAVVDKVNVAIFICQLKIKCKKMCSKSKKGWQMELYFSFSFLQCKCDHLDVVLMQFSL